MSTIDHGMDVAEIEKLGRTLQDRYAADVRRFIGDIEKLVNATSNSWVGKDSADFRSWWPAKRSKLMGIADDLHGYGQSALNNASDQLEASDGASGTSGGVATPDATGPVEGSSGGTPGATSYLPGPKPFSNGAIADAAEREIAADPHRYQGRLGWSQPGECMVAMSRWLNSAAGASTWPGSAGGPLSGYESAGAATVPLDGLARGDILQKSSASDGSSWNGVHTVVVLGVDPNNSNLVRIAESNYDFNGNMRTTTVDLSQVSSGLKWTGWRFGDRP